MRSAPAFILLCLAGLAGSLRSAQADAIVITKAMQASTIAEVFVDEDAVRIEIEVGRPDEPTFVDLLPDSRYAVVAAERGGAPAAERHARFLREGLVVEANGERLQGTLETLEERRRTVRDEITGEPLPGDAGQGEPVVFARIVFPLTTRPDRISIRPPLEAGTSWTRAEIGFVAYHLGLPVIDFRYLGGEEILDLDWDDPWYTRFENENLRRQYQAPLNLFLYVDPYEVRKEVVLRPKDLQSFIDLGLEGKEVIDVASQQALKAKVAAFLQSEAHAVVDGTPVDLELDRIHFVRRTLLRTGVVSPPEPLPVASATLGVIFVHPLESGWPQRVETTWRLWNDRIREVPAVATDEAGGLPQTLTPDAPTIVWENFILNPRDTGLVAVPAPPPPARIRVPVASLLLGLIALLLLARVIRKGERRPAVGVAVAVLALGGFLMLPFLGVEADDPFAPAPVVEDAEAASITTALLRNVYRAFDHRSESAIYDTLERSVSGDLLEQIYLETRKSLELENQGGARVKVTDVEMLGATASPAPEGRGFDATCTWTVSGSVGHWGHIHQRTNQYEARLLVRPDDGAYKLVEVVLLSEERL